MTCVCRGLTSRLHQLGGQSFVYPGHGGLRPTVFVDTIPELAAARRLSRDAKRLGAEPVEVVRVLV